MITLENNISIKKVISGSFAGIFCLIFAQVLAEIIASGFILLKIPEGICNIIVGVLYIVIAYFLLKVLANKMLKISLKELSMPTFFIKWKWIIIAFILPIVVTGAYLLFFDGKFICADMNGNKIFSTITIGIFYTGIAAGFVEEMVFRGIILNLLRKKWNIKVAVIVPSFIFGVVHILGMDFSIGSCLLTIAAGTVVGIMFSLIVIESGSVWNSAIVHAIWNIVIIGGGLDVGETVNEDSIATYVLNSKAFAVTGGEFGIESSVISLIAYAAVVAMTFAMIIKKNKSVNQKNL